MRTRYAVLSGAAVLTAGLALTLAPVWDPTGQDLAARFAGPSREHPLGTDHLGRDQLSRLVVGARLSLGLTLLLAAATAVLGAALGVLAAMRGGLVGAVVERAVDALVALPAILLGLVVAAALRTGLSALTLAVLATAWTPHARLARDLTRDELSRDWVLATQALGGTGQHVLRRCVLPAVAPALLVHGCLRFPSVLLSLAGLSFLGLGAPPPTPEWGAMIADGRRHLARAPGLLLIPSLAVLLATLGVTALGRRLQRRSDAALPTTVLR